MSRLVVAVHKAVRRYSSIEGLQTSVQNSAAQGLRGEEKRFFFSLEEVPTSSCGGHRTIIRQPQPCRDRGLAPGRHNPFCTRCKKELQAGVLMSNISAKICRCLVTTQIGGNPVLTSIINITAKTWEWILGRASVRAPALWV